MVVIKPVNFNELDECVKNLLKNLNVSEDRVSIYTWFVDPIQKIQITIYNFDGSSADGLARVVKFVKSVEKCFSNSKASVRLLDGISKKLIVDIYIY